MATKRLRMHYSAMLRNHQIKKTLSHAARSSFLDHHQADDTSGNREPLGSDTGRTGSTSEGSDRCSASRVSRAGTAAASHAGGFGAVAGTLAVEPLSGGRDGKSDGQGWEVEVRGDGDG